MKTQEERNTALEHTLDKILGKIEKLSLREEPPIAEDKGSNVKGKPITHIHKSTHFRPPHQQGSRYFYIPPDSTKAQFFTGSEHGETTRDQDMRETEYDLHDCPWSEMELAVFYEAARETRTIHCLHLLCIPTNHHTLLFILYQPNKWITSPKSIIGNITLHPRCSSNKR